MQAGSASEEDDELRSPNVLARPTSYVLLVVAMLCLEELNPVKVFCKVMPFDWCINERNLGYLALVLLCGMAVHQADHLLYSGAKLFLQASVNNIFFRSVEIVGMHNVPKDGPVILTGNHNNQFVDATLLLTNCRREISFMIAEKSWNRPIVGFFAKAFKCIPVTRPQDNVKKGSGLLLLDGTASVRGDGTSFLTEVKAGDHVEIEGVDKPVKVKEVESDTVLSLEAAQESTSDSKGLPYKVMPRVDQSSMYEAVFSCLRKGKCLGIFPEGGSHDRTDLLPLKAGVAVIALDVFRRHKVNVPIVPVGLNYFRGHHFRGRVIIEFGSPIHVDEALHAQHETDRRGATDLLLKQVATHMRSVIVPVPDFQTIQLIYMVRRLYVSEGLKLNARQRLDLDRRFAEALRRIMRARAESSAELAGNEQEAPNDVPGIARQLTGQSNGTADGSHREGTEMIDFEAIAELRAELLDYMQSLKRLGLRDYQVPQIHWWGLADLLSRLLYIIAMLTLGTIPQVLFNLPVGLLARALAVKEQRKALAASSVKIAARDVVMSYKIIYCIALVPCLYVLYTILLICFSGWSYTSILTLGGLTPVFSYFGVKANEQGVRAFTDIAPMIRRLEIKIRREQDELPKRRHDLQAKIRKCVKKCGPLLGDLYYKEDVDWTKEMEYSSVGSWNLPLPENVNTGRARADSGGFQKKIS